MEDTDPKKVRKINLNFQIKDDAFIKDLFNKERDNRIKLTFSDKRTGAELIFDDVSYILSKDGKTMQWFNDDHEGILKVK